MSGWLHRLTRPGCWIAVALCFAFASAWCRLSPVLDDDALHVRLTRIRATDAIDVPVNAVTAQPRGYSSRENEQLLSFGVSVPRAGHYSVYGTSANRQAQPLELRVNGRSVSANAFYQKTGAMREGFERHLLARGVPFVAGENVVTLIGTRAMYRTALLELRREAPAGWARFALLFSAAALVLAARGLLVSRVRLPPRTRLAIAASLYAAGLGAFPAALLWISDGHLVALGVKDPVKTGRLESLEAQLRSAALDPASKEKFNVFVMGDSTHYWSLPPQHRMVPAIQRALPEELRGGIEINGMSGGALNAFDFYLLLNRLVREEPDLVVIPVSLRSFSERWLRNVGYRFHDLDHHLPLSEFLRAWNLSVEGREMSVVDWLLRRLDASWFDGDGESLLRGAKVYVYNERKRMEKELGKTVFASFEAVPADALLRVEPRDAAWNTAIPADHPLFEAYRLINDLAARHGIDVLYYTEQINVEAQRARGRDLRLRENFAVIEGVVAGGPRVHFLMLSDRNPPEIFSDDVDHLTPDGIATVAEALAREIVAIERQRRGG